MKTITIQDKTWQKLYALKGKLLHKNYTETIEALFKLVSKFKLLGELKEMEK